MGRAEEEGVGEKPWKGPIPAPMKGWMDGLADGLKSAWVGHGCVSGGGREKSGVHGKMYRWDNWGAWGD